MNKTFSITANLSSSKFSAMTTLRGFAVIALLQFSKNFCGTYFDRGTERQS